MNTNPKHAYPIFEKELKIGPSNNILRRKTLMISGDNQADIKSRKTTVLIAQWTLLYPNKVLSVITEQAKATINDAYTKNIFPPEE